MGSKADEDADRLSALLDVAIEAVRKGDGHGAVLALAEAEKTAKGLPQKVICLPYVPGPT